MELAFDLSVYLPSELIRLDLTTLRRLNPRKCWAIKNLIDKMGTFSAQAQGLRRVLTTYEKLIDSEPQQQLYLSWRKSDRKENQSIIIGILKVGRKKLYLVDSLMRTYEMSPICILDFYVHSDLQRQGHGHRIFDFMLSTEGISVEQNAIDKPSEILLNFMNKHYGLSDPIWQTINYVVFSGFFDNPNDHGRTANIAGREPKSEISQEKTVKILPDCPIFLTAAGIIHGDIPDPVPNELPGPDTPTGRKNRRDFGHQRIF